MAASSTRPDGPRRRLRRRLEARRRRRLAAAVRRHARAERENRLRAGDGELGPITARTALYDEIATRIEDLDRTVSAQETARLRGLLAERLPFPDYGPYARARDARIAAILAALGRECE